MQVESVEYLYNYIAYLSPFINIFPGSIYWKNLNLAVIGCNDNNARWAGYSSACDLIGATNYDHILYKKDGDMLSQHDKAAIESKKLIVVNEKVTYKKQDTKACVSYKMPVYDVSNQVIALFGVTFNKTDDLSVTQARENFSVAMELLEATSYNTLINKLNDKKQLLYNNKQKVNLTLREFECLAHLTKAKTAKEIAILMNISPRTVENHIENLKTKLHCMTKSQLVEAAIEQGLIQVSHNKLADFL